MLVFLVFGSQKTLRFAVCAINFLTNLFFKDCQNYLQDVIFDVFDIAGGGATNELFQF